MGALKADNYRGCNSWIENTPIDVSAQEPGIRQQDFLQMSEGENAGKWDVLSLSLVLNFAPDPKDRGTKIIPQAFCPQLTVIVSRENATVGSLIS